MDLALIKYDSMKKKPQFMRGVTLFIAIFLIDFFQTVMKKKKGKESPFWLGMSDIVEYGRVLEEEEELENRLEGLSEEQWYLIYSIQRVTPESFWEVGE